MVFIAVTTLSAAIINIFDNYLPKGLYVLSIISAILIVLVCLVLVEGIINWRKIYNMSDEKISLVKIKLIGNIN
jgi:carbon starvation protein